MLSPLLGRVQSSEVGGSSLEVSNPVEVSCPKVKDELVVVSDVVVPAASRLKTS